MKEELLKTFTDLKAILQDRLEALTPDGVTVEEAINHIEALIKKIK